jgi:hypothetical protein
VAWRTAAVHAPPADVEPLAVHTLDAVFKITLVGHFVDKIVVMFRPAAAVTAGQSNKADHSHEAKQSSHGHPFPAVFVLTALENSNSEFSPYSNRIPERPD